MKTTPDDNKALVLEAFDALFNKRDYEAAAHFWSDTYIQHSAHIKPGRDAFGQKIEAVEAVVPGVASSGAVPQSMPMHRGQLHLQKQA
jgi:predicted SnoaL-like aldol condensation-catalyzing enzyme